MTDPEKQCSKCLAFKPLGEFGNRKLGKNGKHSNCKCCEREYQRKYQAANREKSRERQRKYHAANREKAREYQRKYYVENTEKLKEYKRKYYAARKMR